MQLRLGFSIAAHLEPDIFVVDEALTVGDAGFQAKCVERMTNLVREGRTLLFVSHDLLAVEAVCRQGVFLLGGLVEASGTQREVLRSYLDWVDTRHQARLSEGVEFPSSGRLELENVSMFAADGTERYVFQTGEDVTIRLRFKTPAPISRPYVSIGITDGRKRNLVACSMLVDGDAPEEISGTTVVTCTMRNVPLLPRVYEVWSSVRTEHGLGDLFDWQPVGSIRFASTDVGSGPVANAHTSTDGPVFVEHAWQVEPRA